MRKKDSSRQFYLLLGVSFWVTDGIWVLLFYLKKKPAVKTAGFLFLGGAEGRSC